jgi:hypothetical protein
MRPEKGSKGIVQADAQAPPLGALREPACPLCGGANACAPAASGSLETPCWCSDARFAPALLARARAGGRAGCICASCAAVALADGRIASEQEAE